MPSRPTLSRASLATFLSLPLVLLACVAQAPLADNHSAMLAQTLGTDAAAFFAGLAAKAAPECSYEQNKNSYNRLTTAANQLSDQVAASHAGLPRTRAAAALARAFEAARASHAAASARSDDIHGPCMAPGAIALNAEAIARAAAGMAGTQSSTGE